MSELPELKPDDGRIITGVRRGGSTDHGEKGQFELVFEDGRVEPYRIPFLNLPHLVNALRSMGAVIQSVRAGRLPSPMDVVVPYQVRKTRTGQFSDGRIAVHFSMHEGIPVQVAMTRELAETLLRELETELAQEPPKPGALS